MKYHLTSILALMFCFACGCALAEGDGKAADVKEIVTKVCAACHGEDGNKMMTPETPKIGGQKADYLAKALTDYKTQARNNFIMAAVAEALDADTIDALAAYFAKQKSELHTPN